ncbi:hypothetical protein TNCV_3363881 [Trichonephila clavipes]|nr:hypothetical protein TNCV_3363881 [Trichonephila clavipes]
MGPIRPKTALRIRRTDEVRQLFGHHDLTSPWREKSVPNLDYFKVVQTLIPREHVRLPCFLSPPLHRALSKDASINAGTLKGLAFLNRGMSLYRQNKSSAVRLKTPFLCAPHCICGRR